MLQELITRGEILYVTGSILQETLQGTRGSERFRRLERDLAAFPLLELTRRDYVLAAEIWSKCRSKGVQATTIDAQIAAAAVNHGCVLLTADADFRRMAAHVPLKLA